MTPKRLILSILAANLMLVFHLASPAAAVPPGNADFQRTWERTDRPVDDLAVSRTWMWGPKAFSELIEENYSEAPGGVRIVQYFDKSRMEDNGYRASDPWDVTNGLLVVELMTGRMQVGDEDFEARQPAQVNVGGDSDDPTGPTYATMAKVRSAQPLGAGEVIGWTINRAAQVGAAPREVASHGVTAGTYAPETNHRVASVFWAFMTSSGPVWEGGELITDQLFLNPYYATGLPVTEAYWAEIKVGGTYAWVLLQCFERRCLTYTPENPDGWQVEAGNVGQHYYAWRYGQPPDETSPTATATEPAPTATETATATATETATAPPTATEPESEAPAPPAFEFSGSFGEDYDPTTAMFAPRGVALDGAGNIYVADSGNHRIQKYTYNGVFLLQWGGQGASDGEFDNPTGVAVDSNGNVYVTDRDNGRVQIFDADGNWLQTVTSVDTGGQILFGFVWPEDVVIGGGYAWVVDSGQQQLMGFPVIGGAGNGVVPGNLILTAPLGVGFDPFNNHVLVADGGTGTLEAYDLQGAWQYSQPGPAGIGWLFDVTVSAAGEIWVIDRQSLNGTLYRKPPGGLWTGGAGQAGAGREQFNVPGSISAGLFGEVIVADTGNNRVKRISSDWATVELWSDDRRGRYDGPVGIEWIGNGGIYIVDSPLSRVQLVGYQGEFVAEWGAPTTVPASEDLALLAPSDIAINESGDIYVVDSLHHRVIRYDGWDLLSQYFPLIWGGAGSAPGQFSFPRGIALDQDGNVYVSDTGNQRIQKFDADGQFITEWGALGAQSGFLNDPSGLAVAGDVIYVVDRGNNRIQQFDLDGSFTGLSWGGSGSGAGQFNGPDGIAIGPDGNVYVADRGNHRVQAFTADGQFLRAWGSGQGSGPDQFSFPSGIAFDRFTGDVMYVTDTSNRRVQILSIP